MKELPNAIEVEKKLLSALMLKGGEVVPQIAAILSVDDFYRPEHRFVFQAILDAYNPDVPLNIILVEEELRKNGTLDKIKRAYLFALLDMEFTTTRAEAYAQTVREMSYRRKVIEQGRALVEHACDEGYSLGKLKMEMDTMLLGDAYKEEAKVSFERTDAIALDVFQNLSNVANAGKMPGVTTGLIDLNMMTNGLRPSNLIILAARPAMGKTALALNIAEKAARAGNVVAMFSLEMSKPEIGTRLLSSISRVPLTTLNRSACTDDDYSALLAALEDIERLQFFVDDSSNINVAEMRVKARRLKQEHGLNLIVVDYLQLMRGKGENRVQEVSEISRGLKALAKELDVPVLALSQLSRSVELRAEKKPQLSDLRDSGSIEQDADMVMFLYREDYYNRDDIENQNIAELILAKNRNGATGSIRLYFQKEIVTFSNLTRPVYAEDIAS